MLRDSFDIVIVGAGHGGAQTAIALRQRGFMGTVVVLGEDAEFPYERPPLSKEYLLGERTFERILIRPETFWSERDIAIWRATRVVAVDPEGRTVTCEDGRMIAYGRLVWAAGGHARRLDCAGHGLAGVHSVRSRADVDTMVTELERATRVAVIGGGYVGLEAAAALAALGKHVTVLEAQDRVLARVAGETLARFYESEHRSHGVEIRLDCIVECIEDGGDGRAVGVRLAGGEIVPAELVIVGIGIVPAVAPLIAAGAEGGNGVAVDGHGRTSLVDVFAVGDCALHANAYAQGRSIRLESVQNANDMATVVASALTSDPVLYDAVPWFWSKQYDLRLQTVGLSTGHDATVTRGDPADRSFSVIYLRSGSVVALDCVNATRDYVQGRALVTARAKVPAASLADDEVPLKTHVGAPRVEGGGSGGPAET